MKNKVDEFLLLNTEERKKLNEIRGKRYHEYKNICQVTVVQNIVHQAKINAVRDRILEACEEYKTHLAERIYFAKKRIWHDGNASLVKPSWRPHPNISELKTDLDQTTTGEVVSRPAYAFSLSPMRKQIAWLYSTIYDDPALHKQFSPHGINLIKNIAHLMS